MKRITLSIIYITLFASLGFSQTRREIREWTREYSKLKEREASLKDYIKAKHRASVNQKKLSTGVTQTYGSRDLHPITADELCRIGDFENISSLGQYFSGAYHDGPSLPLDFDSFTLGLSTINLITSANSRQTIVANGDDPTINEPLNTAFSGNKALRLGNRINGHGVELLSVDLIVPPQPILTFRYAMVLQNPSGHNSDPDNLLLPFFQVRTLDQNGNEITGTVNLGNGSNIIQSNDPIISNSIATSENVPISRLRYRPWDCVQIVFDPAYIGQIVTIQFINSDCALTAHFAYTYIDDISCSSCTGPSPSGNIEFSTTRSNCDKNNICFEYFLPKIGSNTGEVNIELEVRGVNGHTQTYSSGVLNSGNLYCFDLPESDVNLFGGGYDFVAVADFTLNNQNVNTLNAGAWPDGQLPGSFNDCLKYEIPVCCPPMDSTLLVDLFNHVSLGAGLTSPYNLEFNSNAYFADLWQAYLDYIYLADNSIEKLVGYIRLIDAHDPNNPEVPLDNYSPMVSNNPESHTWIWFEPGEGGTILGNSDVFDTPLNVNHWYKIQMGIYTEPTNIFEGSDCQNAPKIFYRVKVLTGKLIGEFSDGKRILKRVELKRAKSRNR